VQCAASSISGLTHHCPPCASPLRHVLRESSYYHLTGHDRDPFSSKCRCWAPSAGVGSYMPVLGRTHWRLARNGAVEPYTLASCRKLRRLVRDVGVGPSFATFSRCGVPNRVVALVSCRTHRFFALAQVATSESG